MEARPKGKEIEEREPIAIEVEADKHVPLGDESFKKLLERLNKMPEGTRRGPCHGCDAVLDRQDWGPRIGGR